MKSLFLNKYKKHITWLLCSVSIFNLFFLVSKKAEAQMPVIDAAAVAELQILNGFTGTIDATTVDIAATETAAAAADEERNLWERAVDFVQDKWYQAMDLEQGAALNFKEYFLDPLAWTAANVIIDQFGDALVDWIRNGFDGSPMFLSDPEGFFRDTANQFSGAIIDALDMEWLCDPLGKLRLNIDFFFPGTDRAKYACTFNDIAGAFESYADRDDLSDWINVNVNVRERNIVRAYGSDYRNGGFLMWLFTAQKKNNDLGRTLQTANDAYAAARISVGSEKFHLNYTRGFFGVKKCVEWDYGPEGASEKCIKYEIKTPGALVQDQLDDVGGKDLSRLQVADEIDEIIGALATTMMGWLLTGGNDGEGVMGYDKDADYSGSNRDHYGELSKSQELTQKKTEKSEQVTTIKSHEEPYGDSLEDYTNALYDAKSELETIIAKLKCIKATSTVDTSDNADCDGADEDIKNISLSAVGKTESDITSDIGKTESQIAMVDGEISDFNSQYGENAADTSARAIELFDEFENKVMSAGSDEEITNIKEEYCYSYDKKNETGEICGLFGDSEIYETYKTHSNKEFEDLSKEAGKTEAKMENAVLEYACILDEYTKAEDVTKSECNAFKESSSSSQ